jgi:hypothetical protein
MNAFLDSSFKPYDASKKEEFQTCYVRIPEMRNKEEDHFRQDTRLFNTATLIGRMKEDLIAQGMSKDIQDLRLRRQFIKNQGYMPCNIIPVKEYLVAYERLFELMFNPIVMSMAKLPDPSILMPSSGISDTATEQQNPFTYFKYMQMMNMFSDGSGSGDVLNQMMMKNFMENQFTGSSQSDSGDEMMNMFMMMNMMNG